MAPLRIPWRAQPAHQVLVTCSEAAPWIDGLGGFLGLRGVHLRQAFDAPASLRLLRREGFDLAIISEPLPPLSGLSVLREIRALRDSLPCVYVARQPTGRTLRLALELEAFSVVNQPVQLHVVAGVVTRSYRKRWNLGMDESAV